MQLLSLHDKTAVPGSTNSCLSVLALCLGNLQDHRARGGYSRAHRIKVADLDKGSSAREYSLLMKTLLRGPDPS